VFPIRRAIEFLPATGRSLARVAEVALSRSYCSGGRSERLPMHLAWRRASTQCDEETAFVHEEGWVSVKTARLRLPAFAVIVDS
jgi:hypothetical protein